jgi:glucose/arabinose dehydrogenase
LLGKAFCGEKNGMRTFLILASLCFAACADPGATAQEPPPNAETQTPAFPQQTRAPRVTSAVTLQTTELAQGLAHPWAIAFLPSGDALVTERAGRLRFVSRDGALSAGAIEGLPAVDARNQGGLLDVAVSPNFSSDRLIYWSYAEPRGDNENGTSVARGRLSADHARVENVQVIFQQMPSWRSQHHFGSRLVFDREGRLYITTGERARARERSQDINTHLGKIIRINADGSVPTDNPFVGRANARPEVWSYGHRNVQGADLHPDTGELWTSEHGAQGGDEINIPRAGRNYGWPIITYGEDYGGGRIGEGITQREGMEQPIYYWDPVIAPGDIDFYRGDLFPWRGDLLVSGMRAEAIVRLDIEGERVIGEERFALGVGRIRDISEAPDGSLWIAVDADDGRIMRVAPRS